MGDTWRDLESASGLVGYKPESPFNVNRNYERSGGDCILLAAFNFSLQELVDQDWQLELLCKSFISGSCTLVVNSIITLYVLIHKLNESRHQRVELIYY